MRLPSNTEQASRTVVTPTRVKSWTHTGFKPEATHERLNSSASLAGVQRMSWLALAAAQAAARRKCRPEANWDRKPENMLDWKMC